MKRQPVSLLSEQENEPRVIFLLDEDEGLRNMLTEVLSTDYSRVVAFSQENALQHFCFSLCPDLLIIDYELSEQKGLELLHQLRMMPGLKTIPCILLSAPVTLAQDPPLYIWNLQEPFDLDTLLACVEEALNSEASRYLLPSQPLLPWPFARQ